MDERKAEELLRKIKKRGFTTDAVRDPCDACNLRAVTVFKLLSRLGGRDIKWCMNCHTVRSWRRSSDDQLVEEKDFDIEKFLA